MHLFSGYDMCQVMARYSKSEPIKGLDIDETRVYPGCLKIQAKNWLLFENTDNAGSKDSKSGH